MEIIIDGYNLIGSDPGLRGELEHQRNWLVQRLSLYNEVKRHAMAVHELGREIRAAYRGRSAAARAGR